MLGTRKMHVMRGRPESAERHGAGHVARCTAVRLMCDLGLRGVRRTNLDLSLWGAWCFSDWGSFSSRESIG